MAGEQMTTTVLCMVYRGSEILLQDRIADNWPGVTFPGGHVERDESFVEAVVREVWEETGLTIEEPRMCGIKQFQSVVGERYIAVLFKTDRFAGDLKSSEEGKMTWVDRERLDEYPLVPDFRELLEVFDREDVQELMYRQAEDGSWSAKLY